MWKKICLSITAFLQIIINYNFPLKTQLKNKVIVWNKEKYFTEKLPIINHSSSVSVNQAKCIIMYNKSVYWGFRRSFGARSNDTRSLATRLKPNSEILFWTADFKLLSSTTSSPYSPAPWRLQMMKAYQWKSTIN